MNYRKFYKDKLKIEFDNNYEIHHINGDRKDNDINNLLLLPKILHEQYHYLLKKMNVDFSKNEKIIINTKINNINGMFNLYSKETFLEFMKVYEECQHWNLIKQNRLTNINLQEKQNGCI